MTEDGARVLNEGRSLRESLSQRSRRNKSRLVAYHAIINPPFSHPQELIKFVPETRARKKPLKGPELAGAHPGGGSRRGARGPGPALRRPTSPLPKRLGQTSRLKTKSFISVLFPHYVPIQSKLLDEPLIKSPAMSAITGPGRRGAYGGRSGGTKNAASGTRERRREKPWGRGVGSPPLRAGWVRLLWSGLFLMHTDFEKPELLFQAGSPAGRRRFSAKCPTFVPKQGAQRVRGRPRAWSGKARGPAPRGSPGAWRRGGGLARFPHSETRPSAPLPPNLAPGEAAEFRKLFQKNKIPTLTLLN